MSRGLADRRTAAVLFGCFVCQMGLGCGYVFGATLKHIVAELEWSRAAFAAGGVPLLLAMGLAAPLVGAATERFGARRVVSSATLLLGLSLWLLARMQTLLEFYLASALFGVALSGLGDVAVGAVASRWVSGSRGLALALVYVGSNVGGAAVPVLAERIAASSSWRNALLAVGAGAVALILPFAALVVREPRAGETDPAVAAAGHGGERDLDLGAAVRTRSFWILGLVLFLFYFYYLGVNQHLVAFLSDVGLSDARAAASLSFAVALGIVSKLGVGLLADRIPKKAALVANFAVLAAASFALLAVPAPGLLPVFLVAHGFATAAENVLLPLVVVECFGVRHLARIYGALMVTLFPGGALGPIFAGRVFDALGDYRVAFASFAVLNLAGLAGLLLLRREIETGAVLAGRIAIGGSFDGPA